MSRNFVLIFIFFLPFGMVFEFAKFGAVTTWLAVPFTILVGWFYLVMEAIGDHSESPFEGYIHDVPMLALCRTIEIDLREMLEETKIPQPIAARKGNLL
ncbi:MAG: bestrophin family ion channel [Pseudomonadota bacterium]